jgi:biopolymer transport protein TolQ
MRGPFLLALRPPSSQDASVFSLGVPLVLATTSRGAIWFYEQMDGPARAIALILLVCSFIGWGAMIQKWTDMTELRRRNHAFERRLRDESLVTGLNFPRSAALCPYEFLVAEAATAYQRHKGKMGSRQDIALCMGHVENAVQRGISRNLVRYEEKMVLLSSLVSGGPFLGLLGTVWGVMITFGALTDKATISMLAPGVSGALVTTTLGLIVAIPATFGYNFLLTQVKIMTTELENFASSTADRIELELEAEVRRNLEARAAPTASAAAPVPLASAPEPAAPAPPAIPPDVIPGWEDAR